MSFANKSWTVATILHNDALRSVGGSTSTKGFARSWIAAHLDRFYWDEIVSTNAINVLTVTKYVAWLRVKEGKVMPSGSAKQSGRRKSAVKAVGKRIGGRSRSAVKKIDGFDLLSKVCKFCADNGGVDVVSGAIESLRILQIAK